MIQRFLLLNGAPLPNNYEIGLEQDGADYRARLGDQVFKVEILDDIEGRLTIRLNGTVLQFYWAADQDKRWVWHNGCSYVLEKPGPRTISYSSLQAAQGQILSPMPAQVRLVDVQQGVLVSQGQPMIILEAMKMEIRIIAPFSGCVKLVAVRKGQTVARDELLVEIE